jgi:sugar (pentulose or hexulose) kinase
LLTTERDAELIGDACVGLFALGRYETLAEAAEQTVSVKRCFEPRNEVRDLYDTMFDLYRQSYAGLKDVFQRLSTINYKEDL